MQIAPGSILQYYRPSLSYHLSLRTLFCLFLSDCLRQVLLYIHVLSQNVETYASKYQRKIFYRSNTVNITIVDRTCALESTLIGFTMAVMFIFDLLKLYFISGACQCW